MRNIFHVIALVLVSALLTTSLAEEHAPGESRGWLSQTGHYRVRYTSKLNPIVINRIHAWILHVETADGEPVLNADIAVVGGMPEHNHGLPTSPRMTQDLDDGDYLVEGMRFHMNGHWEITISISAGDGRDDIVIPLEV
jgi:hypothetical protein